MAVRYLCFKNDREIKWKTGVIYGVSKIANLNFNHKDMKMKCFFMNQQGEDGDLTKPCLLKKPEFGI